MDAEWMTVSEAATALGVSTRTVRRYCKTVNLRHRRSIGGRIFIHRPTIEGFVARTTRGGAPVVKQWRRKDRNANR